MITNEMILSSKKIILDLLNLQLESGAQKDDLVDELACGQFLSCFDSTQRGMHGTVAAIRILADYKSEHNDKIRKILKFVKNPDSFKKDQNNILKNAELLYALSFIQAGTDSTDDLKNLLHKKLSDSRNNDDGGWPYFPNKNQTSEIYSSSLAFMALKKHNYNNLSQSKNFLENKIKHYLEAKIENPILFSELCYLLYVFVKLGIHKSNTELKNIIISFKDTLWSSEYCVMTSNYEQNLEYSDNSKYFYVRIPWQLYLMTATIILNPSDIVKKEINYKLKKIIKMIASGDGFIYAYSGKRISTRTYAILHEMFIDIESNFTKGILIKVKWIYENVKEIFINKKVQKWISSLSWVTIVILIIIWIYSGKFNFDDYIQSVLVAFTILLLLRK